MGMIIKEMLYERIMDYNKEYTSSTIYSKKNFKIEPYFVDYKSKKLTGLQRLFIHYQYLLGILPKDNRKSVKYSDELKEAIKNLDEISNQTILLCENKINTFEELNKFKENTTNELKEIINYRQSLRNKARRCDNEVLLKKYKSEITLSTTKIKYLRKELKTCDGIEEKSKIIYNRILEMENKVKNKDRVR